MNKILMLKDFIGKNLEWLNDTMHTDYQGEWCCFGLTKLIEKYIDNKAIISSSCTSLMNTLVSRGYNYFDCNKRVVNLLTIRNIKVGDYCFFDWDASGDSDHIGIVIEVGENYIETLECNKGTDGWKNNKIDIRHMTLSYINTYVHMFVHMYNNISCDDTKTQLINISSSITVSECSKTTGYECDVRIIQAILKNEGLYDDVIDGIFGDNTLIAVLTFQRHYDLEIDGIVGENTWKMLIDKI